MNPSSGLPRLCAIVVAAGEGTRLGRGVRKAAVEVAGEPLVVHALRALAQAPGRVGGVLVVHADDLDRARSEWLAASGVGEGWTAVAGGATRGASTAAGLAAAPEDCTLFLVHDAARPLLSARDRDAVIACATAAGAAILAGPVTDTVHRVDGDRIVASLDRSALRGAQTPQVFSREAADRATRNGPVAGTDEAAWLVAAGVEVRVVEARDPNPKVTHAEDLTGLEARLRRGPRGGGEAPTAD